MPELPEVETTRLGLIEHVKNQKITKVKIRNRRLRYLICDTFESKCEGMYIQDLNRRSKYLRFELETGYILLHLGMSGHLRILPSTTPAEKHDHVDIILENNRMIRYTDPRRFGMVNWFNLDEDKHPLLNKLAPEPLTRLFNAKYFLNKCISKKKVIKKIIMDSHIVVGVGNIYAQECLFLEGISPHRAGKDITKTESENLVKRIKSVLKKSISQGGTTLKDFKQVDGKPGYFAQHLYVYGRDNEPCSNCKTPLQKCVIDNRSTVFCAICQK